LQAIEEKGGKLWILDLIASDVGLAQEIYEKTKIFVTKTSNPICIDGDHMSEDEYRRLTNNYASWERVWNEVYNAPVTGKYMLRWSIEWDFRSFVDVFPSPVIHVQHWIDGINESIDEIRTKVREAEMWIRKYAEWTWVPYDRNKLKIWAVPALSFAVLTVTENIHDDKIFLDEMTITSGNRNIYPEIHTKENKIWEKYEILLEILRSRWILDRNIAYQLEIWRLANGWTVLLQVKEFAVKTNPIEVGRTIDNYNRRTMSALSDCELSLPIVFWGTSKEAYGNLKEDDREWPKALMLGSNRRDLGIHEYDPDVVAFFHWDAHGGVFNHNSFRMTQAVIQKWWVASFWNAIIDGDYKASPADVVEWNNTDLQIFSSNWVVDMSIKSRKDIKDDWEKGISARDKLNMLQNGGKS